MPLIGILLLLTQGAVKTAAVDLRKELGADRTDFLIRVALLADLSLSIEHGMDVQSGSRWPTGELPDALDEHLL